MPLTRIKSAGATGGVLSSVSANDLPAESILQTVQGIGSANVDQTGQTSTYADAVSLTITPTSASNKILLIGHINILLYASVRVDATIQLGRDSSTVLQQNTIYNLHGSGTLYPYTAQNYPFHYLDTSYDTTNQLTYRIKFRQGTSSGTVYHCHGNSLGNSRLIAQEIKA